MAFPLSTEESDAIQTRINTQEELIVGAAVRYEDGAIVFFPIPARHDAAISWLHNHNIRPKKERNYDCGFITNKGRFVSRKEAGEIVLASRQGTYRVIETNPYDLLFSEDMWLCRFTDPRLNGRGKCDCSDDTGLCPKCFP